MPENLKEELYRLLNIEEIDIQVNGLIKESSKEGLETMAFLFFAFLISRPNLERALDYYKVVAEDDYPGMNVYITSINAHIPDSSIALRKQGKIDDKIKKEFKEYLTEFRTTDGMRTLYEYVREKILDVFKYGDFDINKI